MNCCKRPDPPPVDAAISGVEYELTVSGESASGQARLAVDVLKEGWVRIPMPPGLLIREARLDARPVALVDQGPDGRSRAPVLLLSRRGRALRRQCALGGAAHAPEFYRKPSKAASPASTIQTTRAMATVSRNRYMAPPRGRPAP